MSSDRPTANLRFGQLRISFELDEEQERQLNKAREVTQAGRRLFDAAQELAKLLPETTDER